MNKHNRRKHLSKWYNNFKSKLFCAICGESRHWVLEFHHKDPNTKKGTVYQVLIREGIDKALEEVSKCEVLCSNCHKDWHFKKKYC